MIFTIFISQTLRYTVFSYVTPEGFVHTYAGRGSQGVNNNPNGYVDGDLGKRRALIILSEYTTMK